MSEGRHSSRACRGMCLEKRQHRAVEFARGDLRERMPALREDLDLGTWDQARELLGEIDRRDGVILGAQDQGRRLDAAELRRAVKGEDRVDAAGDDFRRGEGGQALRLELAEVLVIVSDPE